MLPLFVTAKIQKISKNAQLYYQKVVNLPFFVTAKLKRSFFFMIYKQKVVVLPLFVTSPFSRSQSNDPNEIRGDCLSTDNLP